MLQALKRELQIKGADRKNVTLLVSESIPYHKVISTMDAIRSYSAVVVTDVVDAELFPDIAFGDAPVSADLAHLHDLYPISILTKRVSMKRVRS